MTYTWWTITADRLVNVGHLMDNFNFLKSAQRFQCLTTLDRVALTATNGIIVYDTTLLKLYIANGTDWVEVG